MIKSYFKIAWRNLLRNKTSSFINIGGLAVGMAVALLIGLWIWDEVSYDRYNENYEHVAEVVQQTTVNGNVADGYQCPIPLAAELRNNYGSAFKRVVLSWWKREYVLSCGSDKFNRTGKFMEPGAPYLLSLKMLKGNRDGLKDLSSILISASVARSIFGNADPMDKAMKIDDKMSVKVTGVYEDFPDNSNFRNVNFIAPWELLASSDELLKSAKTSWGYDATEIFVQLTDNSELKKVSTEIKNTKLNKISNEKELLVYKPVIFLQPMSRWHLYSVWNNGANIQFVWLFGTIGLFVLLLACINFMNLSTARSEKRAKEVGIRKAIGSLKKQLIVQFYIESFLVVGLAFGLSLLLIVLSLPYFNEVASKKMVIPWSDPLFWTWGIAFSVFTGLIAGSYPALYLSSFRPVKVLKGTFKAGRLAAVPRKILVVLQFTVSVALIVGTMVVFQQIQFAKNRPVGYSRDGLLQIQMNTPEFYEHTNALRDDLLKSGAVIEMAESSSPATGVWSGRSGFDWIGKPQGLQTEFGSIAVTPEYGRTVGWQFKEGRDFSKAFSTDSLGLILNEAAVQFMGLKNPIGETIKWDRGNYKVIGVIKNMIMESPYERVGQAVYSLKNEKLSFLFLKINPLESANKALQKIQAVFRRYVPSAPFNYKFVDEEFGKKFSTEERISRLAGIFATFAIFISCLGLFGMASFMAEQRIKEIGVRKVLCASVFNLWSLLSKDFVRLVIISCFIATPIAYIFMSRWLQNYAYHTNISWWTFAVACSGAMLITLLTVSYQSIKAAMANPVKSLRSE